MKGITFTYPTTPLHNRIKQPVILPQPQLWTLHFTFSSSICISTCFLLHLLLLLHLAASCFQHELHFPELQGQWAPSLTDGLQGARPAQEAVFPLLQNPTSLCCAVFLEVPQVEVADINGGIRRWFREEMVGLGLGLDPLQKAYVRQRSGDEWGGDCNSRVPQ